MTKAIGLRTRLFLSHMLVMFVSLSCYIIINRLISFEYFTYQLEDLVITQNQVIPLRALVLEGFTTAWRASTAWSVLLGALAALMLSYWVSQRITAPLVQMEEITQKFSAGQLDIRLPSSAVPEINRLNRSFNRMALRLDQIEQKRRDLMNDLAHELRTPLTIVRGYLEELADSRIEPTYTTFHKLIREVRRLERLVTDLQILSKAETGHIPLQLQAVSLSSLLSQVNETLSTQVREDGPTLHFEAAADASLVWADPDRTEQILLNLVGNALRYTEKGKIIVQMTFSDRMAWITVTDTGPGIPSEELPHVFDRFWRSQQSRLRHAGGSGLGLAITQRLVELQGGTINVESTLGQGSIFRFSLPLAESRT